MPILECRNAAHPAPGCSPPGLGRRQRSPASLRCLVVRCDLAQEIASAMLDVPLSQIKQPSRSPAPVCHARHVAIYLAHVVFQVSLSTVAQNVGRDRTSCAHAVRRIEDLRDDAVFDAELARLERLAQACHEALERAAGTHGHREGQA